MSFTSHSVLVPYLPPLIVSLPQSLHLWIRCSQFLFSCCVFKHCITQKNLSPSPVFIFLFVPSFLPFLFFFPPPSFLQHHHHSFLPSSHPSILFLGFGSFAVGCQGETLSPLIYPSLHPLLLSLHPPALCALAFLSVSACSTFLIWTPDTKMSISAGHSKTSLFWFYSKAATPKLKSYAAWFLNQKISWGAHTSPHSKLSLDKFYIVNRKYSMWTWVQTC